MIYLEDIDNNLINPFTLLTKEAGGDLMHELSLADALLKALSNYAVRNNVRIRRVILGIGQLAQVDKDLLKDNIVTLAGVYGLDDVKFEFKEEETIFKCNACGHVWRWGEIRDEVLRGLCGDVVECDNPIHYIPALANVFIRCPKCNSLDFEVIKGQGLEVLSIEYE
ncbi:MAG: hypothetical protein B6U85_07380 [Desulfurococcales archaeon ex4484_42]|nr:MAG: hypothetical protein B6U85_07380 [Desulfurococcales archaeon ex4484_42]